jgi:hypothetical protein
MPYLPEWHSRKNEKVADEKDDPRWTNQQGLPEYSASQEHPLSKNATSLPEYSAPQKHPLPKYTTALPEYSAPQKHPLPKYATALPEILLLRNIHSQQDFQNILLLRNIHSLNMQQHFQKIFQRGNSQNFLVVGK